MLLESIHRFCDTYPLSIAVGGTLSLASCILPNEFKLVKTCLVGLGAIYSLCEFVKQRQYVQHQKKMVAAINSMPENRAQEEVVLCAIDSADWNRALKISDLKCDLMDGYQVHYCLIEKPEDFENAVLNLHAQNKKIQAIAINTHGINGQAKLAGRSLEQYADWVVCQKKISVPYWLLNSCTLGKAGGAAESISKLPEGSGCRVYASSQAGVGFRYVNGKGEPALVSTENNQLITTYHVNGVRQSLVPTVRDAQFIKRNEVFSLKSVLLVDVMMRHEIKCVNSLTYEEALCATIDCGDLEQFDRFLNWRGAPPLAPHRWTEILIRLARSGSVELFNRCVQAVAQINFTQKQLNRVLMAAEGNRSIVNLVWTGLIKLPMSELEEIESRNSSFKRFALATIGALVGYFLLFTPDRTPQYHCT